MRLRGPLWCLGICLSTFASLWAFRLPFREFQGVEYRVGEIPLPPDWQNQT